MEQADRQYNTYATGRVFDFRVRENMDAYMQLTKTMAEVYDGNTFLFHTIGLGERRMYEENRRNFMLKKLCYRRIAETEDTFIRRDIIDIARTVCGRFLNYLLAKAFLRFGMPVETEEIRIVYQRLTALLSELLRHTKDFSVYETLLQLRETAPVNPDFERTLKENILNNYCRQYAAELIDGVFQKESEAVFDWLQKPYEQAELRRISADICSKFMQTPLSDMQKKAENSLPEALRRIVTEIEKTQKIL